MQPWENISERIAYDGFRKILVKTFVLPNGEEKDFDIVLDRDYVCILALTPSFEVILARQFRPGPEEIYDEIPAGLIEDGEKPMETAKREFLEETGYMGKFSYVGSCAHGTYMTDIGHCFAAIECERKRPINPDSDEFIEVVKKPLEDFIEQLRVGKLSNLGLAYMALDYLKSQEIINY